MKRSVHKIDLVVETGLRLAAPASRFNAKDSIGENVLRDEHLR